jgi:hypothetical protein
LPLYILRGHDVKKQGNLKSFNTAKESASQRKPELIAVL